MIITAFKTNKIIPGDDLFAVLDAYLPPLHDGDVVAVSSKIVSLCQNDVVKKGGTVKKEDVIKTESDYYYDGRHDVEHGVIITLKDGVMGASGGVDESNGVGVYIKLPSRPFAACEQIWRFLKDKNRLSRLGTIITDSHSFPFRYGVIGVGIAWCGFYPLCDYGNSPDIWQSSMKGTVTNHLDALAVSAVHEMGEGDEQTPLCVIGGDKKIVFNANPPTEQEIAAFRVPLDKDIYSPLFNAVKWKTP